MQNDAFSWSMMPFHFWSATFFALGCIVGSFLNVCIYRMPRDMSVVSPPSHCPHCQYAIPAWLNVPLVTWVMLGGKCKNCGSPIAVRYFLVELLTGVAFLASWLHFGHDPAGWGTAAGLALAGSIFLAGLIVATFIDMEHYIIPDEITYGGVVMGVGLSLASPALHGADSHGQGLGMGVLGAAAGAGLVSGVLRLGKVLFGRQVVKLPGEALETLTETAVHLPGQELPYEEIFYRRSDTIVLQARRVELIDRCYQNVTVKLSPDTLWIGGDEYLPDSVAHMEMLTTEISLPREAMGLGDVKFMAAIGAFLGWQGAVFTLLASSVIGAVVGLGGMLLRHKQTSRIPYGPYLAVAAVLWLFGRHFFTGLLAAR